MSTHTNTETGRRLIETASTDQTLAQDARLRGSAPESDLAASQAADQEPIEERLRTIGTDEEESE